MRLLHEPKLSHIFSQDSFNTYGKATKLVKCRFKQVYLLCIMRQHRHLMGMVLLDTSCNMYGVGAYIQSICFVCRENNLEDAPDQNYHPVSDSAGSSGDAT